jgi:hypothetical protein
MFGGRASERVRCVWVSKLACVNAGLCNPKYLSYYQSSLSHHVPLQSLSRDLHLVSMHGILVPS